MKVKAKSDIHEHIIDEFDYQHLQPNQIYDVIGIDDEYYRIIDEIGEPILYPKMLFEVVDSSIPQTWIRKEYGADEYYIAPVELSEPGFYEDYFDGKPEAVAKFQQFLNSMCSPKAPDKESL